MASINLIYEREGDFDDAINELIERPTWAFEKFVQARTGKSVDALWNESEKRAEDLAQEFIEDNF